MPLALEMVACATLTFSVRSIITVGGIAACSELSMVVFVAEGTGVDSLVSGFLQSWHKGSVSATLMLGNWSAWG